MSFYAKTQESCLSTFEFHSLIPPLLMTQRMIFNICFAFSTPKYVSLPVQASTWWRILLFLQQISNSKGHFPQQNLQQLTHKAEKICHTRWKPESKKEEGEGKGKKKSCNLAKGSRTDQLPNHNSKTMSNKKLSKSNFHCHPHFRRSHLPPLLWRI